MKKFFFVKCGSECHSKSREIVLMTLAKDNMSLNYTIYKIKTRNVTFMSLSELFILHCSTRVLYFYFYLSLNEIDCKMYYGHLRFFYF